MEDRIQKNRYDVEARSVLTYLEKLKWRSIFAYEDHCASVIQRSGRERDVCMNGWMGAWNVP
jgi:hypothetical protein